MSLFTDEIAQERDAAMAIANDAVTHVKVAVSKINATIRGMKAKFGRPGVADEDKELGQKWIDDLVAHAKALDPHDSAVLPGTNPDGETATDMAVKQADEALAKDEADAKAAAEAPEKAEDAIGNKVAAGDQGAIKAEESAPVAADEEEADDDDSDATKHKSRRRRH